MASALSYLRLVSDSNGESRFEPLQIEMTTRSFAPPAASFDVSELGPAARCGFMHIPKGWVGDMHPSPMRMWLFFLSGEMEFEISNGDRRPCTPGKALLLEDTTGKGHTSRVVGQADAVLAVVQLEP